MGEEKYNCSHVVPAPCVPYENEVPEWSKYHGKIGCITVADAIEELYEEITKIREQLDLRGVANDCLPIDGDKTVAKVLYAIEKTLCDKYF